MKVRELDSAIVLEDKKKRKADADFRKMLAREEEDKFYATYPVVCEDALVRVAAKKIGVSEMSVKLISLEQKRNLAQMIYEKESRVSRFIRRAMK